MRNGRAPCIGACSRGACTVTSAFNNFSAHADGDRRGAGSESEGGVGRVAVRRVFRHLQIDGRSAALAVGVLRDIETKGRGVIAWHLHGKLGVADDNTKRRGPWRLPYLRRAAEHRHGCRHAYGRVYGHVGRQVYGRVYRQAPKGGGDSGLFF